VAVSYDKSQRAYAKEHNMDLCTVAARGMVCQGPSSEIKSRLIEDCACHTLVLKDDKPFFRIEKLPPDVADVLEDFKLAIVRHRASDFEDIKQHELLLVLNALRHFVLIPKKA
jgi:hypothetical protein